MNDLLIAAGFFEFKSLLIAMNPEISFFADAGSLLAEICVHSRNWHDILIPPRNE